MSVVFTLPRSLIATPLTMRWWEPFSFIADECGISPDGVEKHISSIFTKLDLFPTPDDHRRVLRC